MGTFSGCLKPEFSWVLSHKVPGGHSQSSQAALATTSSTSVPIHSTRVQTPRIQLAPPKNKSLGRESPSPSYTKAVQQVDLQISWALKASRYSPRRDSSKGDSQLHLHEQELNETLEIKVPRQLFYVIFFKWHERRLSFIAWKILLFQINLCSLRK